MIFTFFSFIITCACSQQFPLETLSKIEIPESSLSSSSYFSSDFTKMTNEQIIQSKLFTKDPSWACGDREKILQYKDEHEETQLDRNLCFTASYFSKVLIHGDLNQDSLSFLLKQFDIRHLLRQGPYKNDYLSIDAQKLIYESLKDIPQVFDIHLHNIGYDEGNFVNPRISSFQSTSWKNYLTFMVIRYASGISQFEGSTHEARKRIHLYAGHFPKLCGIILPIQKAICEDGTIDWEGTGVYLKNWSGLLTALSFHNPHHDSEIIPAISVHPFDLQWREKLIAAHRKGIRLIKWMPPQSIPPHSHLLDEYYKLMKSLNMILIAHAGPEHTIPTHEKNQHWADFGNPLNFRKPLGLGVDVILAHCGHNELITDWDDPQHGQKRGLELFVRLAREAYQKNLTGEWQGKLYGDLAAVTTHYGPEFIKELLQVSDEKGIRLLYGSDYPFTNLIRPNHDAYSECAQSGLLDKCKVLPLKEIRNWNPLLANYVFTRNLEYISPEGSKKRFYNESFTYQFSDAPLKLYNAEQWSIFKSNS